MPPIRPCRAPDRYRNARDHEVGPMQVEAIGESQRHQRRRGIRVPHAGRHHADVLRVAVDIGIVGRQAGHGDRLPGPQFIEPDQAFRTEHRDDHHLHGLAGSAAGNIGGVFASAPARRRWRGSRQRRGR